MSDIGEVERALLRAQVDSMLDPQVLLEAVYDPAGRVVDFTYRSVNSAACSYLGLREENLVGHTQLESSPNFEGSELQRRYIQCLDDGRPVILDDYEIFNEILHEERRYDIRATRAGPDLISLTWRDVTERFRDRERVAASEQKYRLLAENAGDVVSHVRDGVIVWVSPSVEDLLGAPPQYWVGRRVLDTLPPEDLEDAAADLADIEAGGKSQRPMRVIGVDGVVHWVHMNARPFYDADGRQDGMAASFRVVDDEMAVLQAREVDQALLRAHADSMLDPQVLLEAVHDPAGRVVNFTYRNANPAACSSLLREERELVGSGLFDFPGTYESGLTDRYAECLDTGKPVILDDVTFSSEFLDEERRYDIRATRAGPDLISLTWRDVTKRFRDRERVAADQALLRAHADSMLDPQVLFEAVRDPAGRVVDLTHRSVNSAACSYLGLGEGDLVGHTQLEISPDLEGSELQRRYIQCVEDGRPVILDDYAMFNEILHDERRYDIRATRAGPDVISVTWRDVTERFQSAQRLAVAAERNRILAKQVQDQSARITEELKSAAAYMASIMPDEITGRVTVTSRYLPSRELGGDSVYYAWMDDDHLLAAMIDVSGHGIEPALLSVSVHNMLRSGSLGIETMLAPEAALTRLNRLFQMDGQGEHYFTMWLGVYEVSSRTLRYASAGAPPALAFHSAPDSAVALAELSTPAVPVGVFEETVFTSRSYTVPPGCRILIYSDGACEIPLADEKHLNLEAFKDICARLSRSPDWSLDELIDELRALTPAAAFEDDCSLIQLAFD